LANGEKLEQSQSWAEALKAYQRVWEDFHASEPTVAYQALLRKANIQEKQENRAAAFAEYGEAIRAFRGNNNELAAEATLQAGLFSRDKLSANEGEKTGNYSQTWKLWRQLLNDFPQSKAAATIEREQLLPKLEEDLQKMHAKDWKYQLIDTLVRATGRNPNFSYALALIMIALVVKGITYPLTRKQYKSMHEMRKVQPLMKELQAKYKGAELSQKTMELYKEHGVNPFAGCGPAVVQIPFLILVFTSIQTYEVAFTQGKFLWVGSALSTQFPHIFGSNLSMPDVPLLAMYVITNYVTMRMTPASDPAMQQQQNTMALLMSGFFFYLFLTNRWSSAFVLYWLALNLISIAQQYKMVYKPIKDGHIVPHVAKATANGAGAAEATARPITQEAVRARPRRKKK
jgi:YidC/Oxa1 family membrane protein insertase